VLFNNTVIVSSGVDGEAQCEMVLVVDKLRYDILRRVE
jgi:hypothetical protein